MNNQQLRQAIKEANRVYVIVRAANDTMEVKVNKSDILNSLRLDTARGIDNQWLVDIEDGDLIVGHTAP